MRHLNDTALQAACLLYAVTVNTNLYDDVTLLTAQEQHGFRQTELATVRVHKVPVLPADMGSVFGLLQQIDTPHKTLTECHLTPLLLTPSQSQHQRHTKQDVP